MPSKDLLSLGTLRGAANVDVTPGLDEIVDEPETTDVMLFLNFPAADVTTTLYIGIQTAITADEDAFVNLISLQLTSGQFPLTTYAVANVTDDPPPMRFFRYAITGDKANWSTTGRITGLFKRR